jgi:hypothetical protein
MSTTIVLNSTNKDANLSNRFVYNFPSTVRFSKNDTISLNSLSIYHSFFNVTAERGNNTISVIWNADTSVQYNYTIPDGNYSIPQLNYFLQFSMVSDDLYLINSSGDFVYYAEIVINSSEYGAEIRCFGLPTAADMATLGYTIPSGASWSNPVSTKTPQVIIPTNAMGILIGHVAGTFPTSVESTDQVFLSTITPQIAYVNCLTLTCSLLNSSHSIPPTVWKSLPIKSGFGSMLTFENMSVVQNKIAEGNYSSIVIEFYDQHFNKLAVIDNEVTINVGLTISEEK